MFYYAYSFYMSKIFWTLSYVIVICLANLYATVFLTTGFGLQLSLGTILFGLVFTIRDKLHEFGKVYVYWCILVAMISSTVVVLSPLNSDRANLTLRVVLASATALIISELTDTEVFQKFIKSPWLKRVFYSNLVSVPLDSILFNLIAFWGIFSGQMLFGIIFGEIVYKYLISLVFAGILYFGFKKRKTKKNSPVNKKY
jgi:queuosine precursor transporter